MLLNVLKTSCDVQERCRDGRSKAACITAYACGAFAALGSDMDRLAGLRALAGLWITHRGADLEAALRGWALLLTVVDVRTLSVPLIDATLQHLAVHLSVHPPVSIPLLLYIWSLSSWHREMVVPFACFIREPPDRLFSDRARLCTFINRILHSSASTLRWEEEDLG
jgi:hypothetical protein